MAACRSRERSGCVQPHPFSVAYREHYHERFGRQRSGSDYALEPDLHGLKGNR